MGLFDKLKKSKIKNKEITDDHTSDVKYKGINIDIQFDIEDSMKHLDEDYAVLQREGIDKVIMERFIPWIKGDEFKDRDDNKIFEGLKLYEITYDYGKIVAEYSPIKKDGLFGQFEFSFESSGDYTDDMFEAVAMQIYVYNSQIVEVSGYDI